MLNMQRPPQSRLVCNNALHSKAGPWIHVVQKLNTRGRLDSTVGSETFQTSECFSSPLTISSFNRFIHIRFLLVHLSNNYPTKYILNIWEKMNKEKVLQWHVQQK